ncbi:MAG: outer membrane protein assembly factor BamE [Rhodospirillales bacterium]|nr:outer membrane protein assembly factor BamE [Alphaproteobacteria bacterium]MCB1839457.1 outer membrane protein assembly factor BamE [Alphaproteobacteria bacterium]MCB9976013.1 outer membrane protein assembly factor BamE [Rhodospirillales bacterium]
MKHPTKILLCVFSFLTMTACAPVVAKRGNMVEDYKIQEVKEGESTRSDVLRILGSPTTVSTFNPRVWYYMGQTTEKKGIMDPKIVDEKIVEVAFNSDGIVESIQDVKNKREDIPITRAKTPTHGNDLTLAQQLLGNLGRFNPSDEVKK